MPNTLRKLREQISHLESKAIAPAKSLREKVLDEQACYDNPIDARPRRKVVGFKEWLNGQI